QARNQVMDFIVFMAVIAAAALHAIWNALAKTGKDKHLSMAAIVLGHAPFAALVLPFVPLPAAASWPFLLVGIGLHFGYQLFLLNAYRIGDLTQVYPIARGTAPLLVALISVLLLGVDLTPSELTAVIVIGAGVISLGLVRQQDGLRNVAAGGLALATGCFIASYSLVDGLGARLAGTALGFYGWLALGNAALFAFYLRLARPGALTTLPSKAGWTFALGGGTSFIAYALVVWSFTLAPIALVTALRETSIVFALAIGVFFLNEKLSLWKLLSTFVTLVGAALLRLSKT
ncbi:MAG: EamA family transporter, partial [Geminicoccaceae bacterium]